MGLFDSITFMNEGEQAEAYKARRVKEKKQDNDSIYFRATDKRNSDSAVHRRIMKDPNIRPKNNNFDEIEDKLIKHNDDAKEFVNYHIGDRRNTRANYINNNIARDTVDRDMRRHPDRWKRDSEGKLHRESFGLFESVEFINE